MYITYIHIVKVNMVFTSTHDLQRTVQIAQSILEITRHNSSEAQPLRYTGRQPDVWGASLNLRRLLHSHSSLETHRILAIESLFDAHMASYSKTCRKEYQQVIRGLHSLELYGLADCDVETKLLSIFEARFRHHYEESLRLVISTLQPPIIHANSREKINGFTQVSTSLRVEVVLTSSEPPQSSIQHSHTPKPRRTPI